MHFYKNHKNPENNSSYGGSFMADPKQDKKKEANSEGTGFKTVMGGFDKNEVNLYINKLKRQMKEQSEDYERRISNLQTNLEDAHKENQDAKKFSQDKSSGNASLPSMKDNSEETKKMIEELKAESDKKIMELRKSVLDERRNVAKFDKECAMAKMSEKKVREEYDKLKQKYLDLKKKGVGGSVGTPVTTSNADEVMNEAGNYAKEIVAAAKNYAEETVKAANKYKADVEAELKERANKLNEIKKKLDDQIRKTSEEQAESAKKVKDITGKLGSITALFDSFASQFNSVNSQITDVTGKIDGICKQFNDTTGQIDTVAKQISETTSKIDTVSKQINDTTSQINSFSKTINETTDRINEASRQMSATTSQINETSKAMTEASNMISETSKAMNATTDQISKASQQMNGFTDSLNGAKSEIADITKIVDSTKMSVSGAKAEVADAQKAANVQASSADLSPINKISDEIMSAVGDLKARFEIPKFDESRFSPNKFNELKNKFKFETTYKNDGSANTSDDDDIDLDDNGIISSLEIDSPDITEPSDEDLMADMPDIGSAPTFAEEKKPEPRKTAPPQTPEKDKTERPGLDDSFEDFFLTDPKDDDMSGEIPLINMEGVGVMDDFSLDSSPEPLGDDFDITPNDMTISPDKGDDLGADIFDIAIDPSGTDDNTLADMMAEASAADKAANKDLTPSDLNFNAEDTLPSESADDFGEFADLFAAGSSQTEINPKAKKEKPSFRKPPSDDPWSFGTESSDDSDLSADSDLSDLLI